MTMLVNVLMTLLLLTGMFMILIVLLQRGRGGGLAGAFGGAGGQSAFGTKAGDVFTKVTIVVATLWVILAGINIHAMRAGASGKQGQFAEQADAQEKDSDEAPAVESAPKPENAADPGENKKK
ncbi:MAG: preprotein translocase subunit SecG [Planctomycetaceae bacterium]|nr:preprotein translocase subunit SecG [Planctomycetaceae bacterium]